MSLHSLELSYIDGYYTEINRIHNDTWEETEPIEKTKNYIFRDKTNSGNFQRDCYRAKDEVLGVLNSKSYLVKDVPLYELIVLSLENMGYELLKDEIEEHKLFIK